jgi:hypothetical protein
MVFSLVVSKCVGVATSLDVVALIQVVIVPVPPCVVSVCVVYIVPSLVVSWVEKKEDSSVSVVVVVISWLSLKIVEAEKVAEAVVAPLVFVLFVVLPLSDADWVVRVVPFWSSLNKDEKLVEPDACVLIAPVKGKPMGNVAELENEDELEKDSVRVKGADAISCQIIMAIEA